MNDLGDDERSRVLTKVHRAGRVFQMIRRSNGVGPDILGYDHKIRVTFYGPIRQRSDDLWLPVWESTVAIPMGRWLARQKTEIIRTLSCR